MIGLAIGDRFFFAALREMGARHSTQVFALSPISATLLAWLALGETLALGVVIGIIIAISGVMIVTSEKKQNKRSSPATIKGILYATLAALCHSVAFVLAKHIMGDHIDPLDATLVRMVGATVTVWLVAGFQGKALATVKLMSTGRRWVLASSGALLGPSLGAWAALAAVTYAPVGIASTLMSLTPIMVIPLVILLDGERVSPRAFLGAAVSFVGVTLIFAY